MAGLLGQGLSKGEDFRDWLEKRLTSLVGEAKVLAMHDPSARFALHQIIKAGIGFLGFIFLMVLRSEFNSMWARAFVAGAAGACLAFALLAWFQRTPTSRP